MQTPISLSPLQHALHTQYILLQSYQNPHSTHVVCTLYIRLLKASARMEVVYFLFILHIYKLYPLLQNHPFYSYEM